MRLCRTVCKTLLLLVITVITSKNIISLTVYAVQQVFSSVLMLISYPIIMEVVSRRSNKIFRTVEFIIYFLKAVGLAPFSVCTGMSVKRSRNTNTWAFKFSNVGLGYNILFTILFPTTSAYFLRKVLSANYTNKSPLTHFIDTFQIISAIVTIVVILISWIFNQEKAACIINRLLRVQSLLSSTKMPPSHRKNVKFLFAHLIINAILWILLWTTTSFTLGTDPFPTVIFITVPDLVICLYMIEYSMIIELVTAQFESLNKNLLHFEEIRNYSVLHPLFDHHLETFSSSIYSQLTTLRALQRYRIILFEISQDISNFFSIPVLVCFAYSFFVLVSNVYHSIIPVVAPNGVFELNEFVIFANGIIIIAYHNSSLLYSATKNMNEAKLTGQMVHKLMASSTNQQIEAKLQQFSLQLLHENVDYTACGFFTLDLTLLHAMLGSMATYLVILIQFQ